MDFILILFGTFALVKGLVSLFDGLAYRKKVIHSLNKQYAPYTPKVGLIVPCKGLESGLAENIQAILDQDYRQGTFVFVTESSQDPAYLLLANMLSSTGRSNIKLVTAGMARYSAQKIQNLLRGIEELEEDIEVIVFADSDIRPHPGWLRNLVAPLQDINIGTTTGYRWYIPVQGNFWSAVRSVWNMTTANVLFSDKYNFAWGGSMAIRKTIFQALSIAQKWQTGLSDDLILTQAVKAAGYKINFVPQSTVSSYEKTTWSALVQWASRQLTIVRLYEPGLWKLAAYPHWAFTLIFVWGLYLVMKGLLTNTAIPIAAWLMLSDLPLGAVINSVRFSAFKRAMAPDRRQMQDHWWAYLSLHPVASLLMSWCLVKSARSKRITWRGIQYETESPNETAVLDF